MSPERRGAGAEVKAKLKSTDTHTHRHSTHTHTVWWRYCVEFVTNAIGYNSTFIAHCVKHTQTETHTCVRAHTHKHTHTYTPLCYNYLEYFNLVLCNGIK